MTDDQVESALRRFTVRGPDPRLRQVIVRPGEPSKWWAPAAAAAILLAWIGSHASSANAIPDPARETAVRAIAVALGNGEDAVRYAEAAVPPDSLVTETDVTEESW
jgi:hypothetical protein